MITAAALLALVLFITLLATGRGWNNVLSPTRNDLVFAGRNQAYGAYRMRREHHGVMVIAFFASLGLVSAGLALPELLSSATMPPPATQQTIVEVDLKNVFVPKTQPKTAAATTTPERRNRNDMTVPIAVDTASKAPVDTTSRTVDPGPIGPIGPVDTLAGKGPGSGGGGTPPGPDDLPPVDVMPEYPGGQRALERDLQRFVHYPELPMIRGEQGRVLVGFIVAEDGSMIDIKVVRSVSPELDAEAVRAVRKLKKWIPGKFRGKDVKVRYALPINFKLAKQ